MNGLAAEDHVAVRVDGQAKVGLVHLEFRDIVFEEAGIPLAVTRVYDSRNANRQGDFGYGWDLDVTGGRIQHNRPVGSDWVLYTINGELPCQHDHQAQRHFTLVTLSEHEWYVFAPEVANVESISGACSGQVFWNQVDGTSAGATLTMLGNNNVRSSNSSSGGFFSPFSPPPLGDLFTEEGEIFDPDEFELDLADGRHFRISTGSGIESITDQNGNSIFISDRGDGFASSSGDSMHFVRDALGRITQITDPAGRSVGYSYDGAGNLTLTTDVLSRSTRFKYTIPSFPHHLTTITDFRGIDVAALEYQADGRLAGTCDPDGVCLQQTYDLASQAMQQVDALGAPVSYTYDLRGRILTTTDALGHTTRTAHATDSIISVLTNPDGSGYTRDVDPFAGDILAETQNTAPGEDPALFRTSWTYQPYSHRVLTQTLPTGGTIHHAYDANGNESDVTDDDGHSIFHRTYDVAGRPTAITDRFGTTHFEYTGSEPHATHILYPDTTDATLTYDTLGNVSTITRLGVTMRYIHDAQGRILFADYGRGVTVSYEYTEAGINQWTAISGPSFGRVTRHFSAAGRLTAWTLPNGDAYSRTYDLDGRVLTETGPEGNTRHNFYDLAGRLDHTVDDARGATTRYERDGVGRVTATIDALSHRTESTYDLRGALRTTTDARGKVTHYDETPLSSVRTDALTRTTSSARTSYGLPGSVTLPGGATTHDAFNGETETDQSSDYLSHHVDELGRTRTLSYDVQSTLTAATDVGGVDTWSYNYQDILGGDVSWDLESGRVWLEPQSAEPGVGQYGGRDNTRDAATPDDLMNATGRALSDIHSPSGELTHRAFDARGHLAELDLPNGGVETRGYDASGRHTSTVLAHGTTLTYTLDAAGREMSRDGSDGSHRSFTYGPSNRVETYTDATGTTTLGYDPAGRWTSLTSPSGARWSRTFDALDRVATVTAKGPHELVGHTTTYTYDPAGNLSSITDPLGGVTTYSYDDANQLTSRTLPNGVISTWAYNDRGWVMEIAHRTAAGDLIAAVTYTRSPSGEPTHIAREDGDDVDYGYDVALRLSSENYADGDSITYAFDADSNRTTRVVNSRPETYTYLAGALLAAVTVLGSPPQTFAYDQAGRTTDLRGSSITWDANDHITSLAGHTFTFDAQDRRTRIDSTELLTAPTLAESLESPHLILDATGNPTAAYVYQSEHPLLRYDPASGDRTYYLTDAQGTVIALVGDDASNHATLHYDAFGNPRAHSGALADLPLQGDFRFQGMWLDAGSSSTYYVRARTYDPATGRFLSRDPYSGMRGRGETFAPYIFADSSPAHRRDASGRASLANVAATITIAAVLGSLANALYRGLNVLKVEDEDPASYAADRARTIVLIRDAMLRAQSLWPRDPERWPNSALDDIRAQRSRQATASGPGEPRALAAADHYFYALLLAQEDTGGDYELLVQIFLYDFAKIGLDYDLWGEGFNRLLGDDDPRVSPFSTLAQEFALRAMGGNPLIVEPVE